MNDKKLYEKILGITPPWNVTDVHMEISTKTITIYVREKGGVVHRCAECNRKVSIHDHRVRRWRHLPTCQFRTIIEARVARVECPEHGVHQLHVPWAEENSSLTALFEALVILWLQEASIAAVARLMGLSWSQVDGVLQRAVERGLAKRESKPSKSIGIDETSYQKHHEYVTILSDRTSNAVVDVLDDRRQESLQEYFSQLPQNHKDAVQTIAMDMWDPYIAAIRNTFCNWEELICFDRFHIAQHYGKALDKTRAVEHRQLHKELGESVLTRTKHSWLQNSSRTDNRSRRWFLTLTRANLKTSRAWAIKETASQLWGYVTRGHASRAWKRLIGWMKKSRLPAMQKLAKTIEGYLWGILNAVIKQVTNAKAEAINSRIQWIKKMACGFRNRKRFRNAILFHLGKLDLVPKNVEISHLIS